MQGEFATLSEFQMDAPAQAASKDQTGQAKLPRVLTGGGSLDPADFSDLVQRDRASVLENTQNLEPTMVSQPLKNPFLAVFWLFRAAHKISKFAKILINYKIRFEWAGTASQSASATGECLPCKLKTLKGEPSSRSS